MPFRPFWKWEEKPHRSGPGGMSLGKKREEIDGRKQPFGSKSVSMTPGSLWGLGSTVWTVAVCPPALGLWTGHPVKWTSCFLPDQGKGPWCQPRLGPGHSRASLSSRALGPSAPGPSMAPKLPQSAILVNGSMVYLAAQAHCRGITLGSSVSLTPTPKPPVSFHFQNICRRGCFYPQVPPARVWQPPPVMYTPQCLITGLYLTPRSLPTI